MNYVELHIGDYEKDTAHLSACEDGIYGRLIRRYYNTEGALPADVRAVQRLARAHSKEERQAVADVLQEFFTESPDGWRHKRCDQEIERYNSKREKARQSAEARWKRRGGDDADGCERNANALPSNSGGNAPCARVPHASHQSPVTNNAIDTPTRADTPSRADDLARALREMGWGQCSGGSPDLLAAAAAGVTVAGIREAAAGKEGKSVAYVARRAIGRLQDANAAVSAVGNGVAATPEDPRVAAERQWRWDIEAEILDVEQRCDRMGLITPADRDDQVRRLKAQLAAGWPEAMAVHA